MSHFPKLSPYAVGLSGKCPRCGRGRLFGAYLKFNAACDACGLDFASADTGDGPAVILIFLVGFVAVAIAFIARFVWEWSIGAAFGLSTGFAIAFILAALPPLKAVFFALQYRHRSGAEPERQ